MPAHVAKHAGIAEDEHASVIQVQRQMIVGPGVVVGGRDKEFACHAEVNTQPAIRPETKGHLFGARFGSGEGLPHQAFLN